MEMNPPPPPSECFSLLPESRSPPLIARLFAAELIMQPRVISRPLSLIGFGITRGQSDCSLTPLILAPLFVRRRRRSRSIEFSLCATFSCDGKMFSEPVGATGRGVFIH
jgi:hypothetical protein